MRVLGFFFQAINERQPLAEFVARLTNSERSIAKEEAIALRDSTESITIRNTCVSILTHL